LAVALVAQEILVFKRVGQVVLGEAAVTMQALLQSAAQLRLDKGLLEAQAEH
jgi:hypothetical protein